MLFKFTPAVGHKQHHQTENVQQTRANQIPYLPGRGRSLRRLSDQLLDLSLFLPVTLHLSFLLFCFCALQHEQGPDHGPDRPQVTLQDVISRTERRLRKREIENMEGWQKVKQKEENDWSNNEVMNSERNKGREKRMKRDHPSGKQRKKMLWAQQNALVRIIGSFSWNNVSCGLYVSHDCRRHNVTLFETFDKL